MSNASNIETRILTRLLVSFSSPDSADGENLSAAEMLTVVDIAREFPKVHPRIVALFEAVLKIARTLEANPKFQLDEVQQKKVLGFWDLVAKSQAFHTGSDTAIDLVTLKGLEDIG